MTQITSHQFGSIRLKTEGVEELKNHDENVQKRKKTKPAKRQL